MSNDHVHRASQVIEFPVFRADDPVHWFLEMENLFRKSGVTTDSGKCAAVAAAVVLNDKITADGFPTAVTPASPGISPYEMLKSALLSRWTGENKEARPSELLAAVRARNPGLPDSELRVKWLRVLPCRLRFVLDTCDEMTSAQTAALADRIADLVAEATTDGTKVAASQAANLATKLLEQRLIRTEASVKLLCAQFALMKSTCEELRKMKTPNECNSEVELGSEYDFEVESSESLSEMESEYSNDDFESTDQKQWKDLGTVKKSNFSIENENGKKNQEEGEQKTKTHFSELQPETSSKGLSNGPSETTPALAVPSCSGVVKNMGNCSVTSVPPEPMPSQGARLPSFFPLIQRNSLVKSNENSLSGAETKDTGIDSSECEPKSEVNSSSSTMSSPQELKQKNTSLSTSSTEPQSELMPKGSPKGTSKDFVKLVNSLGKSPAKKQAQVSSQQEAKNEVVFPGTKARNPDKDSSKSSDTVLKSSDPSCKSSAESTVNMNPAAVEYLKGLIKDIMNEMKSPNEQPKPKKKGASFVCYYHARFGRASYRCRSPCEFDELSSNEKFG